MMDDRDGREREGAAGAAPADVEGGPADGAAGLEGANDAGGAGTPEDGGVAAADVVPELERVQRELSAMADRHLRLAAEFDNYRKRVAREQAEQHTRSQAELARRVLDALDDLQRVDHFDPAQVTTESLLQALQLVERKFRTALESVGLEEIEAQGAPFNPEMMEALMTAPAETPEEDDTVLDVFQKGYRLGNTLVRPAQVRVKKFED